MSLRKGNKIIAGSPEIVESGSNANGTYVKYSDGRMECYKRVTQKNVKLTGTWYGLYINENDTTVDLGNYAATFIEEPTVNITYMGGNGCWLINNNGHSASSPGKVQLCTVSSRTIGTCILDVTAKGKWKSKEKEGITMVFVILLLVGLFAIAAFKIANEKDKDD